MFICFPFFFSFLFFKLWATPPFSRLHKVHPRLNSKPRLLFRNFSNSLSRAKPVVSHLFNALWPIAKLLFNAPSQMASPIIKLLFNASSRMNSQLFNAPFLKSFVGFQKMAMCQNGESENILNE
jgi:hypothetical protein